MAIATAPDITMDAVLEASASWRQTRQTRLQDASDDLMAAIDRLVGLTGCWEFAVDELVNVTFTGQQPPVRPGVSPERLAAAREHLYSAGLTWAAAATNLDRTLVDTRSREFRRRVGSALDRIGHQGSPVFRDRLVAAFNRRVA